MRYWGCREVENADGRQLKVTSATTFERVSYMSVVPQTRRTFTVAGRSMRMLAFPVDLGCADGTFLVAKRDRGVNVGQS